jgi:hypothetical protein
MKISIKPSFYVDCLPPHFRRAVRDVPRFPESGLLPERIDANFEIHRMDSVYEAGLDALELASIQLVSWGVPGLAVKHCLTIEEVVLREVRVTFYMQALSDHRRWEVMQLSDIECESTHDEAAVIIYANASLERDQWPHAASDVGPLASVSDVVTVEARLTKGYLESYGLNELANWQEVDLRALCGTLFDVLVLGIPFVPCG